MRKAFPLLLLLVLIPFAYHGCKYLFTPNIAKAGISKSTGFGKVNPDFFAVFEDRPTLNLFRRALEKAEKQPVLVDAVDPHYDVEIRYPDGRAKGLHLWLFPEVAAGSIMDVTNTSTIYTLPPDIARELTERLKPYADPSPDEPQDPADAEQSVPSSEVPDAPEPAPEPAFGDADIFSLVIRDVPIPIGAWDNEIDPEAILGAPVSQTVETLENADTLTGSFLKRMDYDGLRIELFSPKQNGETFWILSMKAIKEGYRTPKNIEVGSSLEDLLTAYPEIGMAPDGRTDPGNAAYAMSDEMGDRYLQFEVTNGRVAEIHLYRLIN